MPRSQHILISLAMLGSTLVVSTASAAPYVINTCGLTDKVGGWHTTSGGAAAGHITAEAQCPPVPPAADEDTNNSPYHSGLSVNDTLQSSSDTSAGAEAGWQLDAPVGATITRFEYWRTMRKQSDDDWKGYVKLGTADGAGAVLDTCSILPGNSACGLGGIEWGDDTTVLAYRDVPAISTDAVSFGVRCTPTAFTVCANGFSIPDIRVMVFQARITLDDPTPPATPTGDDRGWTASGPVDGSVPLTVSGADSQSGIKETRIYVDGQVAASTATACDFSRPTPCPSMTTIAMQLNTTTLADGLHDLEIATLNGADVETRSTRPALLEVDNHGPGAPVALSAVRRDTTNTFDVSWKLPADGPGVASALYQLCASSCTAPQPTTTLTTLTGITLPGPQSSTLRVWLLDRLGHGEPGRGVSTPLAFQAPPGTNTSTGTGTGTSTTTPPPAARVMSRLKVGRITRSGRFLTVKGVAARAATGAVRITLTVQLSGRLADRFGRAVHVVARARLLRGRFSARLPLPSRVLGARHARFTVNYRGDTRTLPGSARATVPARVLAR